MQRSFSTFPDGRPGIGLLLLRATVGFIGALQGVIYWADSGSQTFGSWAFGLPSVTTGISLLIGFLTSVSAVFGRSDQVSCFHGLRGRTRFCSTCI